MRKLAEAIILAAKIREESFDHIAADSTPYSRWVDYTQFYTQSLQSAADKAAEQIGFDTRGTTPIYLLLANSWNEALEWAEEYLKSEAGV